MNHNRLGIIGSLAGLAVIAVAIAFSFPPRGGAQPGPSTPVVPAAPAAPIAPDGCRPVAPGSYTFICPEGQAVVDPSPAVPDAPTAAQGCRPVAPGSYTSICPGGHTADGPLPMPQQPSCQAVAPGSYTSICIRP
jgi:hypothetical protein